MANNADIKFNVDNLELFYGNFKALKGIDMEIKKNEITALIGPSGCGKSTFLKTLNRMNDLEDGVKVTGRIHLDGVDIYKEMDSITLRHRVGMVFQQPNPFPKSIYDNVAYGPRIHGMRLGIVKTWDAKWYAGKDFAANLHEDIKIRSFLKETLKVAGVSKIETERSKNRLRLTIHVNV